MTAIVGTNPPRIYRHGRAPQGVVAPYITWLMFGVPENNLSDLPPMDRQTVQIDYWSRDDKEVVALAIAGRDAIEPFAHMTAQPVDERETETQMFHIAQTFDWFVSR